MLQRACQRSLVLSVLGLCFLCTMPARVDAQGTPGPSTIPQRPAATPGRAAIATAPPATPPAAATVPNSGDSNTVPQARPDGAAPRRPPDPQLVQVLQQWEKRTGNIKRMQGDFLRYEYEHVFRVEKRHIGRYYYEAPDQGRMDFLSVDPKDLPPTHDLNGMTYNVVAGSPESWICNGIELLSIQITDKTYHKITIPQNYRGEAIKDGPLPFLFGMKSEEALRKYEMNFGQLHMQGATPSIHIVAYPLMPEQRREFQRAEMLIDPRTFEPIAVKLFDPSGNKETVYAFQKHDEVTIPWLNSKFRVNLVTYKCLNEEKAPPKRESMRQDPNGPVIR